MKIVSSHSSYDLCIQAAFQYGYAHPFSDLECRGGGSYWVLWASR